MKSTIFFCGGREASISFSPVFIVGLAVLFFGSAAFGQTDPPKQIPTRPSAVSSASPPVLGPTKPYELIEKPQPGYTETARYNGVEGVVRLKVEFLATGEIGEVIPMTYLPNGLTERAVAAAKKIKFKPKLINGKPETTIVDVDYNFSIFYENDDKDVATPAMITSMPKPEIKAAELPASAARRISVVLFLGADRRVSVFRYVTELPDSMKPRFVEAVKKIRFRPAVHRSGKRTSVTKTVVYEF